MRRKAMTRNLNRWASATAFATLVFCGPGDLAAREAQGGQPGAQSPPAQQQPNDKDKQPAPLSMDTPQGGAPPPAAPAPATPEEEAAFKAFQAVKTPPKSQRL